MTLNKEQITNMTLLQQERHKLEGKLEILQLVLKRSESELSLDNWNHYVELQEDYSNELTIIENELSKLYKKIRG